MSSLPILFEDDWIVVVHKPSGVPSQSTRSGRDQPVQDLLRRRRPYLALHHRLDQPASGVLALSKHRDANPGLAHAFSQRLARRTYLAILSGTPDDSHIRLDMPLDGKEAVTHVHVSGQRHAMTAAVCRLETGRLHQIRRHAQLAGLPIVGDRRYGGEAGSWLPRLALHAWRLELTHPITHEPLDITAPLARELVGPWRAAGGPSHLEGRPVFQ